MGYIKEIKYKQWKDGESYEVTAELFPFDDVVTETMKLKKLVSSFFKTQESTSKEPQKPQKNIDEKIIRIVELLEKVGDKGTEHDKILRFNKVDKLPDLTEEQADRVIKYLEGKINE